VQPRRGARPCSNRRADRCRSSFARLALSLAVVEGPEVRERRLVRRFVLPTRAGAAGKGDVHHDVHEANRERRRGA
jgi:hypothetical protein